MFAFLFLEGGGGIPVDIADEDILLESIGASMWIAKTTGYFEE